MKTNGEITIYLYGGKAFKEERSMFWNFVNPDKSILEQAKENWKNQNLKAFSKIPNDDKDYVPLPRLIF